MEFRILGPAEVWAGGWRVPITGSLRRALLAGLLLHANQVVATDALLALLWDGAPPRTAVASLQVMVHRLRRALEPVAPGRLVTRPGGYLLVVQPGELDLDRFDQLVADGKAALAAGRPAEAAAALRRALELWRGPALLGAAVTEWLRGQAARLEERRLAALEDRIEADLRLGRHADLVPELEGLVSAAPLRPRERLFGQLMVALYRSGRQADALAVYRRLRARLAGDLGLDPGSELQRLEQAILRNDPALAAPAAGGGADNLGAGAAAAPGVVPAQLPADVVDFTGRGGELEQLDTLLAPGGRAQAEGGPTGTVIAIVAGTAGVGKTALAVHWAHRVASAFPDGQLYVNLRGHASAPPLRAVEALTLLLRALGVDPERVPVEEQEAAGLYRSLLAGKRMLVVLDNAAGADQVRPLLPGSAGCVVLVTSRDRLDGLVAREGARRLTLGVLPPAEARALLSRIIDRERVEAEPPAAAELARLCAYLPLALRIAAANLAAHPHHSIAAYNRELAGDDRLAALAVDGDGEAAVRAAFELSEAALPAEARRLFRLLGLVPGPDVSAGAAATLAGISAERAHLLLERLAGAHLLDQHAPGRFAFHDLLRLYAGQLARARERPAARQEAVERLLGWYLRRADAAARVLYPHLLRLPPQELARLAGSGFHEGEQAEPLAWLDAERPNLVAAVWHAAAHGPRPAAWLLADTLRGYFALRRHTVDWLAAARAGLAAASSDGDARAQAACRLSLGHAYWSLGGYPSAAEHYQAALALARRAGWEEGEATILANLGLVHWELGQLEPAADQLAQALALDRRTGRRAGQANHLANLGFVERELGRLDRAADHCAEALALYRELGSRGGEANALSNLGLVHHDLGHLDRALTHLTEALARYRAIGDRSNEGDTLNALAAVHRDHGRYTEARDHAQAALALARKIGDRRTQADSLNTLAATYERLGRHRQALGHHAQALQLARETGTRYQEAEALVGLSTVRRQLGALDQAVREARQALAIARRAGYRLLEGHALLALADAHLARGDLRRALRAARAALAVHSQSGHRLGEARARAFLEQPRRDAESNRPKPPDPARRRPQAAAAPRG
jgi:DNA-binding SARP family transcriptional activator/Tfp pilus assembly protein PilF